MQNDDKNENSYRSILKGTSILGGVQIFQILVNLVRGKFVAMFLGPDGMGVASLFTSSSNTISGVASLGLNLAFVKEVAAAKDNGERLATVMRVATTLLRMTAMLGALVCVLLSPWLSRWSFGSEQYAWQYMLLAVGVYLNVAAQGKTAMLQGLHKIKILAYTSLVGAVTGLVAGVPLYYFFGTKGIVPAMIILSASTFACYCYGLRKSAPDTKVRFRWSEHRPIVARMILMGLILLASSIINTLCTYGINIFVRAFGDLSDVGLFNAANSLTTQYAGVVFAAMAMDYFPRLSSAASDNARMQTVINRQMEIVALIATPMALLLIATTPLIIRILLTSEFLCTGGLMRWLGVSVLLKALAYPLGYITYAKNNRRLFFWLEAIVCNALYIGFSLLFYNCFGLIGLGYAAVAEQGACLLIYLAVNYRVYGFRPDRAAAAQTVIAIVLGGAGFAFSLIPGNLVSYSLISCVILLSLAYSFIFLRKLRQK